MTAEEFEHRIYDEVAREPKDRISPLVKNILENGDPVFDCHVHIFDKFCVNEWYFLLRVFKEEIGTWVKRTDQLSGETKNYYQSIFDSLSPFSGGIIKIYNQIKNEEEPPSWEEIREKYDQKYSVFSEISNANELFVNNHGGLWSFFKVFIDGGMEDILKEFLRNKAISNLNRFEGRKIITTVLMMDFWKAWHKEATKKMHEQVSEIRDIGKRHAILPFLALDPRRGDELFDLFLSAFKNGDGQFFGVKLYPAMGYLPADKRLDPIFKICNDYGIPITTHCGGEIVSTFEKSIVVQNSDGEEITINEGSRKKNAYYLNDPARWEEVLAKYPKLKLNFAHFGSSEAWDNEPDEPELPYAKRLLTIVDLMSEYDNVYSDFSFNVIDNETHSNFSLELHQQQLLKERSLFGTDYWVVLPQGNLIKRQDNFFNAIGDTNLIEKLVNKNPLRFYF